MNVTTTVVVSLVASEPDTGYIVILQDVGAGHATLRVTAKTMSSFTVATDATAAFDWLVIR